MTRQLRGSDLKELRAKYGVTQRKAAEILGANYNTYLSWEYNNRHFEDLAWHGVLHKFDEYGKQD